MTALAFVIAVANFNQFWSDSSRVVASLILAGLAGIAIGVRGRVAKGALILSLIPCGLAVWEAFYPPEGILINRFAAMSAVVGTLGIVALLASRPKADGQSSES